MRWLTLLLLGVLAVSFQTTLGARLALGTIQADWMFIILVHYSLHSRDAGGPLAGWILGLMVDLTSVEPLGVVSLVYCLQAVLISSLRSMVFTRHPLTHFLVTGACCALAQLLLRGHFMLVTAPAGLTTDLWKPSLLTGLYTAGWAIPGHQILLRCDSVLRLRGPDGPVVRGVGDAL